MEEDAAGELSGLSVPAQPVPMSTSPSRAKASTKEEDELAALEAM